MRRISRRAALFGGVAALVLGLAACGGDGDGGGNGGNGGDGGNGGTTVAVTLQEFAVLPEADSAPAGIVTFEATNTGPSDPHELVVIRTDLAPEALPTDENGVADESGEGIEVLDEIPEFDPGSTESLTLDLEAGSYVLICNVFEESVGEAHYSLGMRTAFTVE